jgi:hypothetical protein
VMRAVLRHALEAVRVWRITIFFQHGYAFRCTQSSHETTKLFY